MGSRASAAVVDTHTGAVRGLAPDDRSRHFFSGGSDGRLLTWHPHKMALERSMDVGAPVAFVRHHVNSVLLAAACDDVCIRVFDGARARRLMARSTPLPTFSRASAHVAHGRRPGTETDRVCVLRPRWQ